MLKKGWSILILLGLLLSGFPADGANITKKLFSKSRLKKYARSMQRMGQEPELDQLRVKDGKIVMGIEPSWLIREGGYTRHYYNLMTDLVIGEYDVNPQTGFPRYQPSKDLHRWMEAEDEVYGTMKLLDLALLENPDIRVLLLVSLYGDYGSGSMESFTHYSRFFREGTRAQKAFLDSLRATVGVWVEEFGVNPAQVGVMIDIQNLEQVVEPRIADLVKWVDKVRQAIQFNEQSGTVFFRLVPGTAISDPYSSELTGKLKNKVDYFVLKAHGFEAADNPLSATTPGSDQETGLDLASSIQYYLDQGVSPWQLVVEFPYYNTYWEPDGVGGYTLNSRKPYISYREVIQKMEEEGALEQEYDPYYSHAIYRDMVFGGVYLYDDSLTMTRKYAVVDSFGLAGVGVWGLSHNHTEKAVKDRLWRAMANFYSQKPPDTGWLAAGFLFFLAFMGFPYSVLRYWEVRNILAKYKGYLVNVGGIAFLFFVFYIVCTVPSLRGKVGFYLAMAILGFFAAMLLIKRYISKVRRYARMVGLKI